MAYYEPCGAVVVGGLYTLNSSEGGAAIDVAVIGVHIDELLLEVLSGAGHGCVGGGSLGVDIDQALSYAYAHTPVIQVPNTRPAPTIPRQYPRFYYRPLLLRCPTS
jgi:hypothetical protein